MQIDQYVALLDVTYFRNVSLGTARDVFIKTGLLKRDNVRNLIIIRYMCMYVSKGYVFRLLGRSEIVSG